MGTVKVWQLHATAALPVHLRDKCKTSYNFLKGKLQPRWSHSLHSLHFS